MKIDVSGVQFGYKSTHILDNITFEAKEGKILGILGENGCGKTTLLKCINRMLKPQGGAILLDDPDPGIFDKNNVRDDDVNISELSRKELARCFAIVSQTTSMPFPYTGYDAVRMGLYARSSATKEDENEKIYNAMKEAGALEFAERSVKELSGGELRRVMIARALVQNPKVLLLDEPTLHLDMDHQFALMDLITHLRDSRNMIIIMVTHDLTYAARYCDEVLIMEKGRIIRAGPVAEVLKPDVVRDVFHINAMIEYDERVKGLNVVMIGRVSS